MKARNKNKIELTTNYLNLAAWLLGIYLCLHGGCIAVPVPTLDREVLEGHPIYKVQIASWNPGITTKREVINQLGQPNVIWEDEQVFAYNWEVRTGKLYWAVGVFPGATGGTEPIAKSNVFLVQFDDKDRVKRFEITTRPAFKKYGDFLMDWLKQADKITSEGSHVQKEKE